MHIIVAYVFLNKCEKFTFFCQVLKDMHPKENWFLFSASWCKLIILCKLAFYQHVSYYLE